jgi:hypothetical protein
MADESRNSNAGVIAMLVVIVMLLVGGFLYFEMRGANADRDLEVNVPDVNLNVDTTRR